MNYSKNLPISAELAIVGIIRSIKNDNLISEDQKKEGVRALKEMKEAMFDTESYELLAALKKIEEKEDFEIIVESETQSLNVNSSF